MTVVDRHTVAGAGDDALDEVDVGAFGGGTVAGLAGGWKTVTWPMSGALKRDPIRFTSTRWPISSVGTIDSDGMR